MNWNLVAVVEAAFVVVMLRAHQRALRRAWSARALALSGPRRALVDWLRRNTGAHLRALAGTLGVARADYDGGDTGEAIRVMDLADALVVRHVRWLRAWLERWADLMRALRLRPPTPPAPATPVRLAPLRRLAFVQRLGALLPTRALRFRVNVELQRLGLKWLSWNSAAATLRARRRGEIAEALDDLELTRADLVVLDGQALATLEGLLSVLPPDRLETEGVDSAAAVDELT